MTNGIKTCSRPIPSEILLPHTSIPRRTFGGGIGAVALVAATAGRSQPAQPGRKLGVVLVGLGGYSTGELAPALRKAKSCQLNCRWEVK